MKRKVLSVLAAGLILLLSACADTLSGKDEGSFKVSKEKIERSLNEKEKIDFEKALQVIVLKVMKEKFKNPDAGKGQSFDEMSMKLVDGKSFSGVVKLAEDFLKKDSEEKQAEIKKEIDSLQKKKAEYRKTTALLDQLKIKAIEITLEESWDELVPFLNLSFTNNTKGDIIGEYMLHIEIFAKSTGELLCSEGRGATYNDDVAILPQETIDVRNALCTEAIQHRTKFWGSARYPLKDLAAADLLVKAYFTKITTRNGVFERPKESIQLDKRLSELESRLKALQELKGNLDDLELTR